MFEKRRALSAEGGTKLEHDKSDQPLLAEQTSVQVPCPPHTTPLLTSPSIAPWHSTTLSAHNTLAPLRCGFLVRSR